MPNQKIFCNVPWTNTHIYWDGNFGMCCSEKDAPHREPEKYNIANMNIIQWFKSAPMDNVRKQIRGDRALSECQRCYEEEQHGYESKRIKENFKSVIFTEQAFDRSYAQSPMRSKFEKDTVDGAPVDWHVDLGNECNLACKMCLPWYSSKIAQHFVKWQLPREPDQDWAQNPAAWSEKQNNNWTLNPVAWQNFLDSIDAVPNLNRLHFMGGEPLLGKRFLELLDYLIKKQRTDISISFVTNGTIYAQPIIDRLKQFRSCDIEVSIESIDKNNDYIRQGSNTEQILENIKQLALQQTETFHIVLRTVPQLLSVNNYNEFILWAWQQQLPVQGVPILNPDYLQISVLPLSLRQSLIPRYQDVKNSITEPDMQSLSTGRNPATIAQALRRECDAMINMLNAPEPDDVDELRIKLSTWLQRWDREYGFNAHDYYPEYREFLDAIQYQV